MIVPVNKHNLKVDVVYMFAIQFHIITPFI